MGSYYTPSTPTISEGYFLQPQSRVLLGTEYLFGSLNTTDWTYAAYSAAIGLVSGKSIDLGFLDSVSFSHVPTFTPVEGANIRTSNVYILEGEETTVSVGLREFKPSILGLALGTSTVVFSGDNEWLATFGDKCDMQTRPLTLEFTNVACQVPDVADVNSGITGGIITLYDTFINSGLPLDDFSAKALVVCTLEFRARPVITLNRGNRIGNMYAY